MTLSDRIQRDIQERVTQHITEIDIITKKIEAEVFNKYYVTDNPDVQNIEFEEFVNLVREAIIKEISNYL